MQKIYYAITPSFSTITRYVNEGDFEKVYNIIKSLLVDDNNTLHCADVIASDAAEWCEFAKIGDIYKCALFTILIIDDNE